MKKEYVIAYTDAAGNRNAKIAVVEANDAFGLDMKALDHVPAEGFKYRRGKNVPEVWPVDNAHGQRLVMAHGLTI